MNKVIIMLVALTLLSKNIYANTLYTSPSCPSCIQAKQALNNNCIKYKTINISKGNSQGIRAVPVLDTNDGKRLLGAYAINKWAYSHNNCH